MIETFFKEIIPQKKKSNVESQSYQKWKLFNISLILSIMENHLLE